MEKIKKYDLEIKPSQKRVEADSRSIYFYDYDNHLFEFHTGTLEERLLGYNEIIKNDSNGEYNRLKRHRIV